MYLVRRKRGGKAHLWEAEDTKCRMASTGGLSMRKYVVLDHMDGRPLCHMCRLHSDGVASDFSPSDQERRIRD